MTNKIKYTIGDNVWFNYDLKPKNGTIFHKKNNLYYIKVFHMNKPYIFRRTADKLFKTKNELLNNN